MLRLRRRSRRLLTCLVAFAVGMLLVGLSPTENSLRRRVVKLMGNGYSCSGEQIKAPSGKFYVLTAGHCRALAEDGSIEAIDSSGRHVNLRVIAEDPSSDLLLLEGLPNIRGIDVAKASVMHEHVRTFTHGHGMDTYKTDGELIEDQMVDVQAFDITNDEEEAKCKSMPKYTTEENIMDFGFTQVAMGKICVMHVTETVGTAKTRPGSSGGMIVNDSGELVGVVSAGNSEDNMYVRSADINKFIAGY